MRVHNEKGYWQKSGLDFQPKIILQLDAAMLNPKLVLKVRAKQSLGKVRSHGKDGIRDKCIEVKSKTSTDKILCFDEASGNLVGVEYPKNDNESPPEITRVAKGVNLADQWAEPYMSREHLMREIDDGVVFWGFEDGGELVGVLGIQKVRDVTLIRNAYVRSSWQKRGIGAQLLSHLRGLTNDPILI